MSRKGKAITKALGLILTILLVMQGAFLLYKNRTAKEAEAAGETWLTGYGYRKAVIIRNPTDNPSAISNYQVKVTNPIYNESGLVGSWHFDNLASGQTPDTSGKGNEGQ